MAGHAFKAEATCAGVRVADVVFPESSFVARVKTESAVEVQMRFAETSERRADPREAGLLVNLRVSDVPGWRVFVGRDVGDWQMRSAVVRVERRDRVPVRATSRRLYRVCISECMKLYGEQGTGRREEERKREKYIKDNKRSTSQGEKGLLGVSSVEFNLTIDWFICSG